jgi:hypothetical protein
VKGMVRLKKSGNMTRLLIIGSGLLGNHLAKIAINEFTTFTIVQRASVGYRRLQILLFEYSQ